MNSLCIFFFFLLRLLIVYSFVITRLRILFNSLYLSIVLFNFKHTRFRLLLFIYDFIYCLINCIYGILNSIVYCFIFIQDSIYYSIFIVFYFFLHCISIVLPLNFSLYLQDSIYCIYQLYLIKVERIAAELFTVKRLFNKSFRMQSSVMGAYIYQ